MQLRKPLVLALATGLVSCSAAEQINEAEAIIEKTEPPSPEDGAEPKNQFGFWEARETGPDLFGRNAATARDSIARTTPTNVGERQSPEARSAEQAANTPQIAYSYGFGFQVDAERIVELQQAHVAMCESLRESCRVIRLSQATADSWDGYGELRLQVASDEAVSFGNGLAQPADELGAELISSVRDGEDLSEQIIDTEAKLASRTVLRDKLTEVLRTNRGSVDELVKAEKSVAEINEEIDATRSKLERYRNRIRFSSVDIEYEPYYGQSQLGFRRPVMAAFRSFGTIMGTTVAILIYLLAVLIPLIIAVMGGRWIWRRFGASFSSKKEADVQNDPEEVAEPAT